MFQFSGNRKKAAFINLDIILSNSQSKEQKKQHYASMAIQVTKERIESLSGKNTLHITEENGTLISFVIPLKTDY